ncbi:interaptin-like [Hydractinia symbiolongicarpus]|uniref:interaptin-like n=1 Tax=Hydractinia symbiolongicarpus TaxID=13093 RepID=UPI00254E7626|nr:interaptin-like [Hydractinia symbiolongicarpus]
MADTQKEYIELFEKYTSLLSEMEIISKDNERLSRLKPHKINSKNDDQRRLEKLEAELKEKDKKYSKLCLEMELILQDNERLHKSLSMYETINLGNYSEGVEQLSVEKGNSETQNSSNKVLTKIHSEEQSERVELLQVRVNEYDPVQNKNEDKTKQLEQQILRCRKLRENVDQKDEELSQLKILQEEINTEYQNLSEEWSVMRSDIDWYKLQLSQKQAIIINQSKELEENNKELHMLRCFIIGQKDNLKRSHLSPSGVNISSSQTLIKDDEGQGCGRYSLNLYSSDEEYERSIDTPTFIEVFLQSSAISPIDEDTQQSNTIFSDDEASFAKRSSSELKGENFCTLFNTEIFEYQTEISALEDEILNLKRTHKENLEWKEQEIKALDTKLKECLYRNDELMSSLKSKTVENEKLSRENNTDRAEKLEKEIKKLKKICASAEKTANNEFKKKRELESLNEKLIKNLKDLKKQIDHRDEFIKIESNIRKENEDRIITQQKDLEFLTLRILELEEANERRKEERKLSSKMERELSAMTQQVQELLDGNEENVTRYKQFVVTLEEQIETLLSQFEESKQRHESDIQYHQVMLKNRTIELENIQSAFKEKEDIIKGIKKEFTYCEGEVAKQRNMIIQNDNKISDLKKQIEYLALIIDLLRRKVEGCDGGEFVVRRNQILSLEDNYSVVMLRKYSSPSTVLPADENAFLRIPSTSSASDVENVTNSFPTKSINSSSSLKKGLQDQDKRFGCDNKYNHLRDSPSTRRKDAEVVKKCESKLSTSTEIPSAANEYIKATLSYIDIYPKSINKNMTKEKTSFKNFSETLNEKACRKVEGDNTQIEGKNEKHLYESRKLGKDIDDWQLRWECARRLKCDVVMVTNQDGLGIEENIKLESGSNIHQLDAHVGTKENDEKAKEKVEKETKEMVEKLEEEDQHVLQLEKCCEEMQKIAACFHKEIQSSQMQLLSILKDRRQMQEQLKKNTRSEIKVLKDWIKDKVANWKEKCQIVFWQVEKTLHENGEKLLRMQNQLHEIKMDVETTSNKFVKNYIKQGKICWESKLQQYDQMLLSLRCKLSQIFCTNQNNIEIQSQPIIDKIGSSIYFLHDLLEVIGARNSVNKTTSNAATTEGKSTLDLDAQQMNSLEGIKKTLQCKNKELDEARIMIKILNEEKDVDHVSANEKETNDAVDFRLREQHTTNMKSDYDLRILIRDLEIRRLRTLLAVKYRKRKKKLFQKRKTFLKKLSKKKRMKKSEIVFENSFPRKSNATKLVWVDGK